MRSFLDPVERHGMSHRWWIYFQERFPIFAHGPLILAFSLSAMGYSALLRGANNLRPDAAGIAFVTALFFFLQLRIADEFKDAEEDARYRPYRPVPRGLITLCELGWLAAGTAALQLAGSLWLHPPLVLLLIAAWGYLVLMSKEFFLRSWLKQRPLAYMLSHMLILPIFDGYATACDWLVARAAPPAGLEWFLAASYFNGMVIEIGRKIRAPADEEEGVETYSFLWGRSAALAAWLLVMFLSACCALQGAALLRFVKPLSVFFACMLLSAITLACAFVHAPRPGRGWQVEVFSGIWTIGLYLGLGIAPWIVHFARF